MPNLAASWRNKCIAYMAFAAFSYMSQSSLSTIELLHNIVYVA